MLGIRSTFHPSVIFKEFSNFSQRFTNSKDQLAQDPGQVYKYQKLHFLCEKKQTCRLKSK